MAVFFRIVVCGLVLAFSLASVVVDAAPTQSDKDKARALIILGRKYLEAGEPERALPLFKEAHGIMHVPTTAFDMMRAYGDLNKLVEARAMGEEVEKMPVDPNENEAYREAREQVKAAMEALDTRIPLLKLSISGAPISTVRVKIEDNSVPPEEIDKPIRINPGEQRIEVSAPNCGTFKAVQKAESGVDRHYEVEVNLSCHAAPAPPPPPLPSPVRTESSKLDKRWVAAGFATSGAFLAAGTVLTVLAKNANDAAIDAAMGHNCAYHCEEIYDQQYTRSTALAAWSIPAFVVGGGLTVATVVYLVRGRSVTEKPGSKANISAMITPDLQGVVVHGAW